MKGKEPKRKNIKCLYNHNKTWITPHTQGRNFLQAPKVADAHLLVGKGVQCNRHHGRGWGIQACGHLCVSMAAGDLLNHVDIATHPTWWTWLYCANWREPISAQTKDKEAISTPTFVLFNQSISQVFSNFYHNRITEAMQQAEKSGCLGRLHPITSDTVHGNCPKQDSSCSPPHHPSTCPPRNNCVLWWVECILTSAGIIKCPNTRDSQPFVALCRPHHWSPHSKRVVILGTDKTEI